MTSCAERLTKRTPTVWGEIIALMGGAAVIGGCFLPWYRVDGFVGIGTAQAESVFIVFSGIALVIAACSSMLFRWCWLRLLLLAASLVASAAGGLGAADVVRQAQTWQISVVRFVNLGILVVLAGGLASAVATVVALGRRHV